MNDNIIFMGVLVGCFMVVVVIGIRDFIQNRRVKKKNERKGRDNNWR